MNASSELIFWIVPCPDHEARFKQLIRLLAAPRGAAIFKPHITLGAVRGEMPGLGPLQQALRGLKLSPLEIGESDAFTMSLFVRFEISEQLLRARGLLEALPGFRRGRAFDPHISLMYGSSEERPPQQKMLHSILEAPVVFDRLVAMHIPLPVLTQDDVRKWREVAQFEIARDV